MSNQKSLLPLIVTSFVVLILINGHLAEGQRQFSRDARAERYCGKRIPQMLMLVCQGKYNSLFSKRTSQKIEDEYQLLNDEDSRREFRDIMELDYPAAYGQLPVNEFPFISKSKALSFMSDEKFRRRRRGTGIYEECCLNSCSVEDLKMYCGQ